jgi:hypothetical protein
MRNASAACASWPACWFRLSAAAALCSTSAPDYRIPILNPDKRWKSTFFSLDCIPLVRHRSALHSIVASPSDHGTNSIGFE